MKKALIFFLLIILGGCKKESSNYLTDEFLVKLQEITNNKKELENFRNTPIIQATLNYQKYEDIINSGNNILEDSIVKSKFNKSLIRNKLIYYNPDDMYIIMAMFHKKLNNKPINIKELKEIFYPLIIRKRVLEFDKSESNAFENNCYIDELVTIESRLKENISLINYIDADLLLRSSVPQCANNVEFSELYNEVLFLYINKKPKEILELLALGNYSDYIVKYVLTSLKSPVSDNININETIKSVRRTKNSEIKSKVLESLKIANNKI